MWVCLTDFLSLSQNSAIRTRYPGAKHEVAVLVKLGNEAQVQAHMVHSVE